jgi:penicillin-binding protein 2
MLIRHEMSMSSQRIQVIGLLVIAAILVLLHQLFVIQLQEGDKYTESLRNQTTMSMILPPARGSILDRNGTPLAENKASFDIDIYLRELVGNYARSHHGHLPMTYVEVGTGDRRRKRRQIDVARIVNESIGDVMKSLNLKPDYTARDLLLHYNQKPNSPFTLVSGLDFSTFSKYEEKNPLIPGLQETARPIRYYDFGALAPHLIGYTGAPEGTSDDDYEPEFVGKEGIERSFDDYLQGTPGGKILRKNNMGFILGEEAVNPPKAGDMVYLSIDSRIQWIAEQAMRRVGRGAAVVMDANNGDILAMVSVPSFDPNDFVPKISGEEWNRLTHDPTRPMFDRVINAYAPGSIYKPLIALAALENTNLNPRFTPNTIIDSPGAVWLANRWWKDWSPNGQGPINLRRALAMSCNTFFYQLGQRTGINSIDAMGHEFGLGETLLDVDGQKILYGEASGTLPGPDWLKERNEKRLEEWKKQKEKTGNKRLPRPQMEVWSDGYTINTSIGQGYVEVTPIQMAIMAAAIANGGHVYYPRLVLGIAESTDEGPKMIKEFPTKKRGDLPVHPENLEAVREGMLAVVEEGTGRRAAVPGVKVAGKSGTAQFTTTIEGRHVKDLRTWFNSFAPYDSPRYVVTVMVEGGVSGGSSSAPIVSEIYQKIFAMENGAVMDMTYLTPAIGHFSGVVDTSDTDASTSSPSNDRPPPEDDNNAPRQSTGPGIIHHARGLGR